MFLVSNFPQVPIATTNPATEGAAREQQLRQPLPAPEALAKAAAERELDTERDKADTVEAKQQGQQQQGEDAQQQSQSEQPSYGPESLKSLLAQANPTIERPGQRRQSGGLPEASAAQRLSDAQYAQFGRIIATLYNSSGQPERPPRFLAST
ncbi:hypothetical protein [uncultured Ferrimonas sp.]|uniref:hypothetical protein n=1 Tax=uncultured Ferrimonas sp. TaxID=432640 RepID=UPI00262F4A75|nr:hypothetical protein [uncultured Ferrimonas sp.]